MSNDYKSPAFKKLLDSLQQQSWELELIISGFAIFGLFTAYDPLRQELYSAENNQQIYSVVIYLIALTACSILLFNLLLHVILRGLWIGALGLRYVSGDIDFDELGYADRFRNYLQKRIVSFDKYIATLENYCSVLFAISFLLIFYVISITMVIVALVLVSNFIIGSDTLPSWMANGLGIVLVIFLGTGMVLTLIDFTFQGILKKNKWVAKVYFPIYWVFSFLTLSFLYRPLVYNFLDNRFGKRLILSLTPLYVVILFMSTVEQKNSNFWEPDKSSSSTFANPENYFDMFDENDGFPGTLVIPSKTITTPYLKVFVPFTEGLENRIFEYDSTLKPKKDRRGLSTSIQFSTDWDEKIKSKRQKDSIRLRYLKVFDKMLTFTIDTLKVDGDFLMTVERERMGFETYLDLSKVPEGKNLLKVYRRSLKEKDTTSEVWQTIPFWKLRE
ncbi:MAG: hypothetical protein AAGL34_06145 [Bacteroidota bacterium]